MQYSNGKECLHGKETIADKQIEYGSEEKHQHMWETQLWREGQWRKDREDAEE